MGEILGQVLFYGIGLALAIFFGMKTRSVYKELGQKAQELNDALDKIKEYDEIIDIVLEPDPTLDELDRLSKHMASKDREP